MPDKIPICGRRAARSAVIRGTFAGRQDLCAAIPEMGARPPAIRTRIPGMYARSQGIRTVIPEMRVRLRAIRIVIPEMGARLRAIRIVIPEMRARLRAIRIRMPEMYIRNQGISAVIMGMQALYVRIQGMVHRMKRRCVTERAGCILPQIREQPEISERIPTAAGMRHGICSKIRKTAAGRRREEKNGRQKRGYRRR